MEISPRIGISQANSSKEEASTSLGQAEKLEPLNRRQDALQEGLYRFSESQLEKAASQVAKLFNSGPPLSSTLSASIDQQGRAVVTTEDGYTIRFEGKNEELRITAPSGESTRIWGDPHVEESDGDKWDFLESSTFLFGNNKLSLETRDLGNGTSFTRRVSIYNGSNRITFSGIDVNELALDGWEFDALAHDRALPDGTSYQLELGEQGSIKWSSTSSG